LRPGRLVFVSFWLWIGALAGCSRAPLHHQESFVFGTRVEVWIAGVSEAQARPAAAAVLHEFDRLHRTYHAWKPSELTVLNDALAAGQRSVVSAEMAALIGNAQRLSQASEQLFDPGIGWLIRLWGFQADEINAQLPDPDLLAEWQGGRAGIADLRIDAGRVASGASARLALDFGGYLKGVALDRAAEILREHGVRDALINIGGNVIALGRKNGQRWRVGIQHPRAAGPLAIVELDDGEAIGTSGDYQRYFEFAGKRYCHVLDPRSGHPPMHTQALTVLIPPGAEAGTLSDVLSKPLFIAGDDWPRLARRLAVAAVLKVDASGGVQVTAALQQRLEFVGGKPKALAIVP